MKRNKVILLKINGNLYKKFKEWSDGKYTFSMFVEYLIEQHLPFVFISKGDKK